jgi:hypothetical protein
MARMSAKACNGRHVNSFARLHAAGWTVGDDAAHGEAGLMWIVTGANGENRIEARGATQDEAWRNAVLQAEAMGMAGLDLFRIAESMGCL